MPPVVRAAGALLLVVSITRPPADNGTGSTISLHELFDLLLAGNLPMPIPRWVGVFGYVPAIGGAMILISEALPTRPGLVVRGIGWLAAAASVSVLVTQGPWQVFGGLGPALWLGMAGVVVVGLGIAMGRLLDRLERHRAPRGVLSGPEA